MKRPSMWIVLVAVLNVVVAARYEDCDSPPEVKHANIEIEDNEDSVIAFYTCKNGYHLEGNPELSCDLDTDEWNGAPPICTKISNEIGDDVGGERPRKKKPQDVMEDRSIDLHMASILDMSCVHAKIKAPEIRHGFVEKYDKRRKGDRIFLVAFYSCNDNYEFEDIEVTKLYCSRQQWVGDLPGCVSWGDYNEDDDEDYNDYESVEDEDIADAVEISSTNVGTDSNIDSNVAPLIPPPPATLTAQEEDNNISNEIDIHHDHDTHRLEQPQHNLKPHEAVTDINIIIEPTKDPYTPRFLDNECGPDKGGCEHQCERLLFPEENEPRMRCSCFTGFTLDPNDYLHCHDIDECQINNGGCEQMCNNLPGFYRCSCKQGLRINNTDGHSCIDINECELPETKEECIYGCENTFGSYHCITPLNTKEDAEEDPVEADPVTCPNGYRVNEKGKCIDIDECGEGLHHCENCLNTKGSYQCYCPKGFDLAEDGKSCIDINECEIVLEDEDLNDGIPTKLCSQGCENTKGSFICSCEPNFHLAADKRTCVQNSCQDLYNPQLNRSRCALKCSKLDDSSNKCICPKGYKLNEDGQNCDEVVDICAVRGGYEQCYPGTCKPNDVNSDFICDCPEGYSNEGNSCQDINECLLGSHQCSHECLNREGSYVCLCRPGYDFAEGSTQECVDVDECLSGFCGPLNCVNLPGNFQCICEDGSIQDPLTGVCHETDLCANHNCSHGCLADEGRPNCICPDDMQLGVDGQICVYPVPCFNNNNDCEHICSPEDGLCSCHNGYQLGSDGKSCIDIDECLIDNGNCHQLCKNLPGGYICECETGFDFLSGQLEDYCFDIDECALGLHNCGLDLSCENLNGSYTCLCPPGYAFGISPSFLNSLQVTSSPLDNDILITSPSLSSSCLDIDECSMNNGNCSHFCVNHGGGFQCSCPPGLTLNKKNNRTCVEENSCLKNNGNCSHLCEFKRGQAHCSCPSGFILGLDDHTCEDINECWLTNGFCEHECLNTMGSYECFCQTGYELAPNGKNCWDIDECENGYGNCSYMCINLLGSYACACEAAYTLADDQKTCIDIDECSSNEHYCSHECINLDGGYECRCPDGYLLGDNTLTCLDIDECKDGFHGCSHYCINKNGSFECTCPEGYFLDSDGKTCLSVKEMCPVGTDYNEESGTCQPVNPCFINNGGCSHLCSMEDGCSCPSGLLLSSNMKTCVDLDECLFNNGGCSHICKNTIGSFECLCPEGYNSTDNKNCYRLCPAGFKNKIDDLATCEDIDECSSSEMCEHKCINTPGSFRCICPEGYQLENGRLCVDIDECFDNNGGCIGGECINLEGSFECRCPSSYRLSKDQRSCERSSELRDQCTPFKPPLNGAIHCTKYRHKKKLFYNTKCKVWCKDGYRLEGPSYRHCNASGKWDDFETKCVPITCPSLSTPDNGALYPPRCVLGVSLVGERCRLECSPGYTPVEKVIAECTALQKWEFNGTFECKPLLATDRFRPSLPKTPFSPALPNLQSMFPSVQSSLLQPALIQQRPLSSTKGRNGLQRPYMKCPRNTTVFLEKGQSTAHIIMQKPVTNIDDRFLEAHPSWAKSLQARLGVGTYTITFRGTDHSTGLRARCKTIINVQRADPIKVTFCTPSMEVTLGEGQSYRSVSWTEPRFEGPFTKIYKSRLPGALFGVGTHSIYYEAKNDQGLNTRCEFKIIIKPASEVQRTSLPMIDLSYSRPAPLMRRPSHSNSLGNFRLLDGHESYIVCPNQKPVKVTNQQSVNIPIGCVLRNIQASPLRHYMQRRLLAWTPFSGF